MRRKMAVGLEKLEWSGRELRLGKPRFHLQSQLPVFDIPQTSVASTACGRSDFGEFIESGDYIDEKQPKWKQSMDQVPRDREGVVRILLPQRVL